MDQNWSKWYQVGYGGYPELVGQRPVDDNAVLDDETSKRQNGQNQHVEEKDFLSWKEWNVKTCAKKSFLPLENKWKVTKEFLVKGKDQYSWPPRANNFRSVASVIENTFLLFKS